MLAVIARLRLEFFVFVAFPCIAALVPCLSDLLVFVVFVVAAQSFVPVRTQAC